MHLFNNESQLDQISTYNEILDTLRFSSVNYDVKTDQSTRGFIIIICIMKLEFNFVRVMYLKAKQ